MLRLQQCGRLAVRVRRPAGGNAGRLRHAQGRQQVHLLPEDPPVDRVLRQQPYVASVES